MLNRSNIASLRFFFFVCLQLHLMSFSQFKPLFIFHFTACIVTDASHFSAAGKKFRGVQRSSKSLKLFGPKFEQGKHVIFYWGTVSSIFHSCHCNYFVTPRSRSNINQLILCFRKLFLLLTLFCGGHYTLFYLTPL